MLTFKQIKSGPSGRPAPFPTFEVKAGAARLGFIVDTGPGGEGMRWKGTAADGTRLAATSKAKLVQKIQIHAAATRAAATRLPP